MTDPRAKEENEEGGLTRSLIELVVMLGLAFALAMGIKTWIVQPFLVPSPSLDPTIHVGDRVLVNKFIYRFTTPKRGDIVVFPNPNYDPVVKTLIKRVVAVGGDTVDIKDDKLWINGTPQDEPYTHGKPTRLESLGMPYTVPQGQVFLMGDNRTDSGDSRMFGAQPASVVEGKAFSIYWPIDHIGGL